VDIHLTIQALRKSCKGFERPASVADLAALQSAVGPVPLDVQLLYLDHNGSRECLRSDSIILPARLLPISEVIETSSDLAAALPPEYSAVGRIVWLWSDDNSNYIGIWCDGPLAGFLTVLDHDSPLPVPAFRTVISFLTRLLAFRGGRGSYVSMYDVPSIPRDLPVLADDPTTTLRDKELADCFRRSWAVECDDDRKSYFAALSMALTPVADTASVLEFLSDDDMFTPELAVNLLELRQYVDAVPALEKLAANGSPNGDSAAIRLLVCMKTPSANEELRRLNATVSGEKKACIESWKRISNARPSVHWP